MLLTLAWDCMGHDQGVFRFAWRLGVPPMSHRREGQPWEEVGLVMAVAQMMGLPQEDGMGCGTTANRRREDGI